MEYPEQHSEIPEPAAATHNGENHPYPPKFSLPEGMESPWLKSLISLGAYLLLGYYIFPGYKILLLITAIVLIHEMGHFLAMKYFRYSELGIFFIPLLGAYVSGSKREVSQLQSAIILLAGPLPGILIGAALYLADTYLGPLYLLDIPYTRIAWLFILLNLINLLPVYPLDGGQLLNRVFLDEESIWSRAFILLSVAALAWFSFSMYRSTGNHFYFILLFFPVMIFLRSMGDRKLLSLEKKIEEAGINADTEYEDLPDADYWRIRDILAQEHPSFSDLQAGPPYSYSGKEEKVMLTIQSLLHRHLIQDLSLAGKLLVFLLWAAGIATPWLLDMDLSFFSRFR